MLWPTLNLKVEDPPLVLTTLNEEWANKMQNISEMLNSNKERRGEEESQGQRFYYIRYKSARGRFYWLGGNSSEEWKGSSNGKWSFACNPRKKWIVTPLNNMTCSWIWKTNAFPKMEFFLWPCFQGRIATRELLWKKRHHIIEWPSCPLCHDNIELLFIFFETVKWLGMFGMLFTSPQP